MINEIIEKRDQFKLKLKFELNFSKIAFSYGYS
jgi:hypothetical protein